MAPEPAPKWSRTGLNPVVLGHLPPLLPGPAAITFRFWGGFHHPGIGLINSLGNMGGFVALILRTVVNDIANSLTGSAGTYALGVLPFLAALMMDLTKRSENKADDLLRWLSRRPKNHAHQLHH